MDCNCCGTYLEKSICQYCNTEHSILFIEKAELQDMQQNPAFMHYPPDWSEQLSKSNEYYIAGNFKGKYVIVKHRNKI